MNKLFKLIYVNLLSLFDINKIIIAREDGVKSNLEKRTILVALLHVIFIYFLYVVLNKFSFSNNLYLLIIGYLVGTIYCFFSDLSVVEPMMFKSDDIDFLLSYPVSKNQILFSKLFTIYLKNMLIVALIMGVSLVCYYLKVSAITDTLVIMYILVAFTVPLIPIIISTIVAYVDDYYKTKTHNSILYKICKMIVILLLLLLFVLVFKNIDGDTFVKTIEIVVNRFSYIYPILLVLIPMIQKESILLFLVVLFIPILCCYLYTLFISSNYSRICSMLKGVKTSNKFELEEVVGLKKTGGLIRKELLNLFKNKAYFVGSFSLSFSLTLVLIILAFIVDVKSYQTSDVIMLYFNLYSPMVLALCSSIGCSTISAMSLEKGNMQILRTLPISMGKILFSKCVVNVIISTILVIINGSLAWICLGLSKWSIMFCYLIPFIAVIFVSLIGIILDYRFIEKNETEDNAIISQRVITMVPSFIALVIGIAPFFMPLYKQYAMLLGAYVLLFLIGIIIELLYLLINRKKLLASLFS